MLETISMTVSHRHLSTNIIEDMEDFEGEFEAVEEKNEEIHSIKSEHGSQTSFFAKSVKQTDFLKVGVLEGTTFLNDYVVVDTLGRGSHGKVKLCLNVMDNMLYAVKIVETNVIRNHEKSNRLGKAGGRLKANQSSASVNTVASLDSKMEQEAEVMKALDHPNLVRLYEVIRSNSSGKLLMVMEYCEAGPLVDEHGKFSHCQDDMPEIIVQHFFKQITSAIEYLHSQGVVHGDIKPENMLLSGDGSLKISDFGQSQILSEGESKLTKTLGTPAFLAPEICAGEEYDGFAADIWALGVTLYFFIFGKLPFVGQTIIELYDNIAEKDVTFPQDVPLSINLQDLFLRLLNKSPQHRITIKELVAHPWICDDDLAEVERTFSHLECMESTRIADEAGPSKSGRQSDSPVSGLLESDSSGLAALVLQSLTYHTDQPKTSENLVLQNKIHHLHKDSGTLENVSEASGAIKQEPDEAEIRSMVEFQNLADQLLATQKSILERRQSLASRSGNTLSKKLPLDPINERSASDFVVDSLHSGLSSCLRPDTENQMTENTETDISVDTAGTIKSPFDVEDVHTTEEVQGAALMHFKSGEKIAEFGKGNNHYAYFVDHGTVELRYLADLPVSFDEVVESCLYDVVKTRMSADLGMADSVCFAENAANITISNKNPRNKSGFVDKSSSSFFSAVSPFQYFQAKKDTDPRYVSSGSVEDSVYQIVETAERVMKSFSNGALGNLLTGTRKKSQFIGVLSLLDPEYLQNKWYFSAIALSDVTVIRMTKSSLEKFLIANPLSQVHLRASMATTVAEIIKLEALEKIALARRKMLSTQAASSTSFTSLGAGLEEVAKHITDTAAAGADILAKLDIFALASKLRDEVHNVSKKKDKVDDGGGYVI